MKRADLLALADRCKARAHAMANEAELCRVEMEGLLSIKGREDANYDATGDTMRWRIFADRLGEHQRSFKITQEDGNHYLDCEAALRAIAERMPE